MVILPAKLSELTGSSKANSTGSSLANSSPGSTQPRQTSKQNTINRVQTQTTWCKHGMLCGMQYVMHMQEWTSNAWTWPQHGNPSVPLEGWGDFGWNRYKEHRNRLPRFGNGKQFKYGTGLRYTASSHLNKMNMLQHSNMTIKYMAGMYSWFATKV